MKNRKQLPEFGYLSHIHVDIPTLIQYCIKNELFSEDKFNNIKVSANSSYRDFVVANEFCKDSFFKEDDAPMMEGEKYRQFYLTEMDSSKRSTSVQFKRTNIFERTKRLDPQDARYLPEADERNYGVRNQFVAGPIADLLNQFQSPLGRVRFARLSAGFSIKPHVDYDPSYIVRYHVPLITNNDCVIKIFNKGGVVEKHLPADGRVYFINAGLKHSAENNSSIERMHLIIDVQDQRDLDYLVSL
jgi:hypothetical protein